MYKKLRLRRQRTVYCFAGLKRIVTGVLLSCLLMLLGACTSPFFTPSRSGTNSPTSSIPTMQATSTVLNATTPTVAINLQVGAACPSNINWDSLAGTNTHVSKVQTVACGSLEGNASLQALVNVRYYSSDSKLDFYVIDNLLGTPIQRFKVQGLVDGDARISPTHSLMTAEIGLGGLSSAVQNLYKEYQWNGSAFVQLLFPGIYPDVTHYQAEQVQALVSREVTTATATPTSGGQGFDLWRNSAYPVIDNLALHIFHWPQVTNKIITYNDRLSTYIVEVINLGQGGGGFIAHLFHLDNNASNIFEIMQVTSIDGSASFSTPAADSQLTSPVSVSCSYQAAGSILGRVVLYDDTYIIVGDTGAVHGSVVSGLATFTLTLPYRLNAKGMQEGVVAFYATSQNNIALSNQVVLVKVFVTA